MPMLQSHDWGEIGTAAPPGQLDDTTTNNFRQRSVWFLVKRNYTKVVAAIAKMRDDEEEASQASPIIAVEVDEEGGVRLEDHEDSSNGMYEEITADDETETIVPASDLSDLNKSIYVITTAALPWRTGTAVNPLLRALYLARDREAVTLMVPWLGKSAAKKLYKEHDFETPQDQEKWIRQYCMDRCNCTHENVDKLRIEFWKGAYNESFGSIFPIEDICSMVDKADVCILEEPEHLNWFRVPHDPENDLGWKQKFPHVVGILHTNYADYAREYGMGFSAPALNSLSALVVKAYCHRVIRLSATLPHLDPSKEVTVNVHGVRPEFLIQPGYCQEGEEDVEIAPVYFIGKLVWAKGFENVLELQEKFKAATGDYFPMDVYGGGKDEREIQKAFFGRKNMRSKSADGDRKTSSIFETPHALREAVEREESKPIEDVTSHSESSETKSELSDVIDTAVSFPDDEKKSCDAAIAEAAMDCAQTDVVVPLDILGDISGKTFSTSIDTAEAALKLIDSVVSGGFSDDKPRRSLFSMAPAKTRFKWRRRSLPARFLGVKDHIEIRDIPKQKIFLNMSTSEVLCTTSAEALAMGKFVILPKHPSNDFFIQFPNCLAYDSIEQCVLKLQYALENEPEPMTEKYKHLLSWEGATERLIKASAITQRQAKTRSDKGLDDADEKAARFHCDAAKRSQYFGSFFRKKLLSGRLSS